MAKHSDLPFDEWHKVKIDTQSTGNIRANPDGNGDICFDKDTEYVYIAGANGSTWNVYHFDDIPSGVAPITFLSDVDSAAQTANYVMATPNGLTGDYSGRALVEEDIPSLPLTKISDVLPRSHGGTELSTYNKGDLLVANNSGELARLPLVADDYVLQVNTSANPPLQWQSPSLNFLAVVVQLNGTVSIPYGETATFAWGSARFDTGSMWNIADPTRLLCSGDGYYRIFCNIGADAVNAGSASTESYLQFLLNGTDVIARTGGSPQLSTVYPLVFDDEIQVQYYNVNGPTLVARENDSSVGMYRIIASA